MNNDLEIQRNGLNSKRMVQLIILKSKIDEIDTAVQPYEIGGILGAKRNDVIDVVHIDVPSLIPMRKCSYTPNVDYLNCVLEQWQENGIAFRGVFHTHFAGVRTLSAGDKEYIKTIMLAMPENIENLYFPVYVLPQRELVCYKAAFIKDQIVIQEEAVSIVDGKPV